jgi:hypothetical protein
MEGTLLVLALILRIVYYQRVVGKHRTDRSNTVIHIHELYLWTEWINDMEQFL